MYNDKLAISMGSMDPSSMMITPEMAMMYQNMFFNPAQNYYPMEAVNNYTQDENKEMEKNTETNN